LFKNCAIQVSGVTTGETIEAVGGGTPYDIWCHGCSWNKVPPGGQITVVAGTVATNTAFAGLDYLYV